MVSTAHSPAIPRYPGLPLFGSSPAAARDLPHLLLRAARYGDVVHLQFGRRPVIFVNSPDYVHALLVEHAGSVEKRTGGDPARSLIMGEGLLNSDGPAHVRERRLCAPAFQPRRITGYVRTMAECAARAQAAWNEGAEIDLSEHLNLLAMDIAGKTLFGADLLAEARGLRQALYTVRRHLSSNVPRFLRAPLRWPTPRNRRFLSAAHRIDSTIYRLIAGRQDAQTESEDLLSMLLSARDEDDGRAMSPKQMRDEAVNLFWAGHETSASALTWTCYLLARHPDVANRVAAEADRVLAGRLPAAEDVPNLVYTEQVFKEALRLYPPIFAFGRQVLQPLRLGEYLLPEGTSLLISPYTLHRRAATFPDPERFDPGRFAPGGEAYRPPSYMPFGTGPRVCIGAHFAMVEGVVVLALLAQHVRFDLLPGQHIEPEVALTQQRGDTVRVLVRRVQSPAP